MRARGQDPTKRYSPLGAIGRGIVAGAGGTAVLTGVQALEAKLRSGDDAAGGQPPARWEDASEPAQVSQRIVTGVFRAPLSLRHAGTATQVVHWSYGTLLGAAYGILRAGRRKGVLSSGVAFGTGVWGFGYLALGAMGLYEPPWKYPTKMLAIDWGRHLAYGLGVALSYRATR